MKKISLKIFLQNRNNVNTLEQSIEHTKKTLETVVEFERGFNIYVKENNHKLAMQIFKRVDRLEHEADIIRRDLILKISHSELAPDIREDLTHLVKRIDRIANATDGAARRLSGIKKQDFNSLGDDILSKMGNLISATVEATKILFNLIKRLSEIDIDETFKICERIQKIEHTCDILHSEIYISLNRLEKLDFNHFVAIQISNFVDMIEEISDKIEDVSDYIEVLKTGKR